ncbi:hypothetical protein BKA59DRAFT_448001 [Fusarium tricinctum]|uniref:Zn(2)-C6 fungal-type domain-containing protein n=1 Tax=Fusarium tricinctum TaxID=61284 RepID=A0A8K0S3J2_9HYPO|nr:hypothetical protein BKA59DRAFT_448001 [Fusarium tricinctum]
MQSSKFPNLIPAPPKHNDASPPVPARVAEVRPRALRASSSRKTATNHACVQCRKTKTKCDGRQCARYTTTLSGERLNRLTHAFNEQKGGLNHLETILAAMRSGTDADAVEPMAWIRIGESVESVVSCIESKSRAVVVFQRSVHGFNHRCRQPSQEQVHRNTVRQNSVTRRHHFRSRRRAIDLGPRTQSYFSYNFGNLPFSSGIKANHYPAVAQQGQLQNYYAKHNRAMM